MPSPATAIETAITPYLFEWPKDREAQTLRRLFSGPHHAYDYFGSSLGIRHPAGFGINIPKRALLGQLALGDSGPPQNGAVPRKEWDEESVVHSDLETSRRLLQAELDKAMHRVQFETEFRALADIWTKLAVLRGTMGGLRPSGDIRDPDEDSTERFKRRYPPFARP